MPPQTESSNDNMILGKNIKDQWYYISVTTIEGIVYYIASQDPSMIRDIRSSKDNNMYIY